MAATSKYYYIWQIDPASDRIGYKRCFVPLAEKFLKQQNLSEVEEIASASSQLKNLQADLLCRFQTPEPEVDIIERASAGLCLRCYVSELILNACQEIARLFGNDQCFTYRDLLPFVLNDDGKKLIVVASDGKTYLTLDHTGTPQKMAYPCFSMQIVRTFKPNRQSSMSLRNWAYLQTKQNPELKSYLSEFGFKHLSDWALLNRTRSKQLEQLAERDRHLIEVFHNVYRRDRRQQNQGKKRCLDPTIDQLQEMLTHLQKRNIVVGLNELITELRRVALQLRQYDVWSHREPLEFNDPETGHSLIRPDLPQDVVNLVDMEEQEQQEILAFFHEQLQVALIDSIRYEIDNRIQQLKKSKKYATFAEQLIPGLDLYYRKGMTLKEISSLLGMSSWAQARRILNPGELITSVRTLAIRQVLNQILKKAQEKGLTPTAPEPDYLENLAQQIESLVDAEIFQEAFEEIQAGKNRLMKSVYAQQLCLYLEECIKVTQGVSS